MRDAEELSSMDGMTYLASVPAGETIVSMVEHKGSIYVATNKHLYKLVADKRLEPVPLSEQW